MGKHLYDFDEKDYGTLLASNVLDASKGTLFAARGLRPNTIDRTILIGLGGTGVRTIDYVKGAISKRLNATWPQYISFLAIDASNTELEHAAYLGLDEMINITRPGVQQRMNNGNNYPAAVRRFLPEDVHLQNLQTDGASRIRLNGKVKIHDQAPGSLGVDEEIVGKLVGMKTHMLPLTGSGTYQVYVIGSVCGGTCSGAFLEMPALIRKAIQNSGQNNQDSVQINAMLYLPDTLSSLDPANASQLYANGYAALKELDYFMGMRLRRGYTETWSYNSAASPELEYTSNDGFIDLPYLIGTVNGTAPDASRQAMSVIAEYLISLLANVTVANNQPFVPSAFLSNARAKERARHFQPGTDRQRELPDSYHQYPRQYAAIGFAEASAPQKLVRAYTVGKVCEMAGMKPVDANTRNQKLAAGNGGLIPFRDREDLLNATVGTQKAEDLLQPIKNILETIHNGMFNIHEIDNGQQITWKQIRSGYYNAPTMVSRIDTYISNQTGTAMSKDLDNIIKVAFDAYRKKVQEYVREEGPFAFANLYNGRFTAVDGDYGVGIGEMLQNLVNGQQIRGGVYPNWKTVEQAQSELNNIFSTIQSTRPPLIDVHRIQDTQAGQWVNAINTWGMSRINEKRRKVALGNTGFLRNSFQLPAAQLTREIQAFGCVLDSLTGAYLQQGEKMSAFGKFQTAQDSRTEVNIAAVTESSYLWLKAQADQAIQNVNAKQIRGHIVDHFFGVDAQGGSNVEKWLEVPDNRVVQPAGGQLALANAEVAVPAREVFDALMAKEFPQTLDVSIETMFLQLNMAGSSFEQTAQEIMKQLKNRSRPQFHGDIPETDFFLCIMYPAALRTSTNQGPAIAQALEDAAATVFQTQGVEVYASEDADSIMCYQLAAPLEIYRLADLGTWEKDYENGNFGIGANNAHLHGLSPDIEAHRQVGKPAQYTERIPWRDYPSIVPAAGDPTVPDPVTGQVSREGQLRRGVNKDVARAKKLGVLYSEETVNGWVIKMVFCDRATQWGFDVTQCQEDSRTGLLPLGRALAEAVAAQNGRTLAAISETVQLDCDGVVGRPSVTEELAWEYAGRTLRFHVPMYERMRGTLEKFEEWAKIIVKVNDEVMRRLMPAQMYWMLQGQILRRDSTGAWKLRMPDGKDTLVANLTDAMTKFLLPRDRKLIQNGLLGYYLFGKLSAVLGDSSERFEERCQAAKKAWQAWMNTGDEENLSAGEASARLLLDEGATLQGKGARLDGDKDATPTGKFQNAMADIDAKLNPLEIDLFYARVELWKDL